jgi:hypothetical protein
MRKIAIVGLLVVLIAGAGGYYAAYIEPTRELKDGLDQAIEQLPKGYSASYRDAQYSFFDHTATISGLTMHIAEPTSGDYAWETVLVTVPNLDFLKEWTRARSNPAAYTQDQPLPIADHIEVRGFTVSMPLGNGILHNITLTKPRLYPWALLHPGLPAWNTVGALYNDVLQTQIKAAEEQKKAAAAKLSAGDTESADDQAAAPDQSTADDPAQALAKLEVLQQQQLKTIMPLARLEAAILMGFGLDEADADGLDFSIRQPAVGSMPATNIRVVLQKLHEGGFDRGVLTTATLDGLSEEVNPVGKFSAKHAVEERISFREPALRLLNGDAPSLAMLNGLSLGHLEVDDIHVTAPADKVMDIQDITLSDIAFDHGLLTSAAFKMDGAKIKKDMMPEPNSQQFFQQFGLDSMTVSFGLSFKWLEDKSLARIQDISLKIDELGALKVSADLSGINPGKMDAVPNPVLVSASIRYDNASLVERLSGTAQMPQMQAAQTRVKIVKQFLDSSGLQADPNLAPSIKQIMRFARLPRSLTIIAAPPMPVQLSNLQALVPQGPAAVLGALGLSVVVDQ